MPKKDRSKSKKGQGVKLWEKYKDGKLSGKLCPKCKSHLAQHADRINCGKCDYSEKSSSAPKAEASN